jgi:hypothetical protein
MEIQENHNGNHDLEIRLECQIKSLIEILHISELRCHNIQRNIKINDENPTLLNELSGSLIKMSLDIIQKKAEKIKTVIFHLDNSIDLS